MLAPCQHGLAFGTEFAVRAPLRELFRVGYTIAYREKQLEILNRAP